LHLRVEPEDCAIEDYSDVSLYVVAHRTIGYDRNNPPYSFETIALSMGSDYQNDIEIINIDRNVNIYITPVRKNYTKKFIIMTDGNVIVSDKTQLNDYLGLYTDEQIEEMNTPDSIIVGYQNTIGFLSTSPEWPWNLRLNIKPAIPAECQGIRFASIGRYNYLDGSIYDRYISYKNGDGTFPWDEYGNNSTYEVEELTTYVDGTYDVHSTDPSICYNIYISRDGLNELKEREIWYIACEAIPKFKSHKIKIFLGTKPSALKIKTLGGYDGQFSDTNGICINDVPGEELWLWTYDTI
jgi:hypothetical protein